MNGQKPLRLFDTMRQGDLMCLGISVGNIEKQGLYAES